MDAGDKGGGGGTIRYSVITVLLPRSWNRFDECCDVLCNFFHFACLSGSCVCRWVGCSCV